MPCGSSERSFRRSFLLGVARVADEAVGLGERRRADEPGSTSIARQSETQAPHWMQAIVWVTSTIASCGTMYSRSGTGCLPAAMA